MRNWTPQQLIDFENRIGDLYMDNKLPFLFHLSGGNEEQLIEIFKDIAPNDYVISNHRSHYHALLHGIPPEELEQKILDGKSMFVYDRQRNFFVSAIIGATPSIAAGIGWALKRKGSNQKVWCFVGDGTEDNGHLFEAVRYVDGWDLPVYFVIECNDRSVEASNSERWGAKGNIEWDSPHVIKYHYEITYPHARKPGMIDLSKTTVKTHDEYFPPLSPSYLPIGEKEKFLKFFDGSYSDTVKDCLTYYSQNENVIHIGYNVARGNAMGTLKEVSDEQKLETPVAENLMMGLAIGMSFEGFKPVVYFERHDFILNAMDAIVNHADKIERISHGEFKVPVIIRAICADSGPFYSGITHSQDFTTLLRSSVDFPVLDPSTGDDYEVAFFNIAASGRPGILIEKKSYYEQK